MEQKDPLGSISDDDLLRRLGELTRESCRLESDLVAHIGEVDARRLYAREASPSMFAYCTKILHLSEAQAYLRISAARAARQYPILRVMLADGRLHVSGIAKLAPHLTRENADHVLTTSLPWVQAADRGTGRRACASARCAGRDETPSRRRTKA